LLPETLRILGALKPLHVSPDTPVFTGNDGEADRAEALLEALGRRSRTRPAQINECCSRF
jgi:hypothetical protein